KAIRLFEVPEFREVRRFKDHHDEIHALTFSADGRLLATAQHDTIGLWDVASGKQVNAAVGAGGAVSSLLFTADGKSLISGHFPAGAVNVWDLAARQPRQRFPGYDSTYAPLALSLHGTTLAAGAGGAGGCFDDQIRFWDLAQGRRLGQFTGHRGSVTG